MRVVATFHPPSAVEHSIKCHLTNDADVEHLVVAKSNRLEVFSLQPQGLQHECSLEIWGHIISLRAISSSFNSLRSNLLILTDHPDAKLIVVSYTVNDGVGRLKSNEHVAIQGRTSQPAEFVNDIFVHPSGRVAVVCCYVGKLRVVEFEQGKVVLDYDVVIPEPNLLALCFVPGTDDDYVLAMVHSDHRHRLQLLCRSLDLSNQELSAELDHTIPSTILSQSVFPSLDTPPLLIPIPLYTARSEDEDGHIGGVLILGGRKALFYEKTSEAKRDIIKGKQQRQAKRLSSNSKAEVQKAKDKEKQREAKKAKPKWSVKWPWSDVTATCSIDDEGRRFLIGDEYGRLAMLVFNDLYGLILLPLGETSPASSLTYLTSQHLYLGSRLGVSQLIRIHTSPFAKLDDATVSIPDSITTVLPSSLSASGKGKGKANDNGGAEPPSPGREGVVVLGKGSYIEVVEAFENVGPVWDAALADLDGSGQPQIITCSGGRNSGSLNVVRTGADFQELAAVHEIVGVVDLWPVRSRFEDLTDSYLVASTLYETYVFRLDDKDSITHLDPSMAGFVTSSKTIAVSNIRQRVATSTAGRTVSSYEDSALVVQVTPEGVRLLEYEPTLQLFSVKGAGWTPESAGWQGRTVVNAHVNASQVAVALTGGRLVLLNLGDNDVFQMMKHRDFPDEISAVSCAPFDPSKSYTTQIAISFWGSNKVAILALEARENFLITICESDSLPFLPCSLMLHNFGDGRRAKDANYYPHVLAGLADGTLVSYSYKDHELKDKKTYPLGDSPVSLALCTVDGRNAVFASGNRAAVLYWDRQRLQRSTVMLKNMVRGTNLNTSFFPSALVVATTTSILIGKVRGVDKMQINSIPLGLDNPRRIAHYPSLKVFGIISKRTVPSRIGDQAETISSFKILDDSSFDQLTEYVYSGDREMTAVLALPGGDDGRSPCFCVGAVQFVPEEFEPSTGQLMLFALMGDEGSVRPANPSLRIVAKAQTPGCVYALAYIKGMIAAAVNTSVILYKLGVGNDSSPVLEVASEWNHNYIALNLVARDDFLIVGDAISSVSILEITASQQLKCVAKDYSPLWPVAVEAVDGRSVIGANSDCNLFSFTLQNQNNGRTGVLERDGSFYLGEVVNKFLPGGITFTEHTGARAFEPKQLFFTSTGRIGVILNISDEIALHLTGLQRNMGKVIIGPGDTHHSSWRAPANSRGRSDAEPSFGFLDGDFLENFFTYRDPAKLLEGDSEAERITMPYARIQDALEELQSLH